MLMSNMGGKLAILAVVPKALTGKVSAKAWSSKAGDVLIHWSSNQAWQWKLPQDGGLSIGKSMKHA